MSYIIYFPINQSSFLYRVPITNGQLNMGTWQVYDSIFNFLNSPKISNDQKIIFIWIFFMINLTTCLRKLITLGVAIGFVCGVY